MGFSASWIAVRGLAAEAAAEALGLEVAGGSGHRDPEGKTSLASLSNGWTVVWFDRDIGAAFKAPVLALARHGPAVACAIEDHVMFSEARGYADGAEIWRVTWDCEKQDDEPTAVGDLPAAYAGILAKAIEEQAAPDNQDVDILWDVPADLAKSICGFRHDESIAEGETFLELRRPGGRGGAEGGGFWRRLFGAR